MKQEYHQLLKPQIINSVSGLALIARLIVDGYLSGLNRSRRVGSGLEFSQYRGYQAGDDMRLLDWKVLARSGRYYIKQSEVDTHIAVKFILDTSKSMEHREVDLSKIDYVRVLVATLAYIAKNQGDAVGLYALNDQSLESLNPTVQKQHFNRLLYNLINLRAAGKWPKDTQALQQLYDRSHKELIFFITDLYEHDHELTDWVTQLKTSRNEVTVLHITGKNEIEFDYKGAVVFEDLETNRRLRVDPKEAREHYKELLNEMISKTRGHLLTHGISYQMLRMDEPLGEALKTF